MPRDPVARITDTLGFISTGPAITLAANIRTAAHALCQNVVTTRFPRNTATQQAAYGAFSNQISLRTEANSGNEQERRMRRSIILLWKAIGLQTGNQLACDPRAVNARTLPAAGLQEELERMILKAAACDAVGVAQVFNEFVGHPRRFFDANKIIIRGSIHGKNKYTGAALVGPGAYQNVVSFHFYYNPADDRYGIESSLAAGVSHVFQAVSVPAVRWDEVPNRLVANSFAGILGTELAGASYMVTTQFTGCSFCFRTDGASTYAAHISPAVSGLQLAQDLTGSNLAVAGGDFANFAGVGAPSFQVFGKGHGNAAVRTGSSYYPAATSSMYLFGVLNSGSWRIYTQSVDVNRNILESRRIF